MQQVFFIFLVCFFLYVNDVNSVSLEFCNLADEGKQDVRFLINYFKSKINN
uniref:Uncharacterized protein n=1 Tax=Meloidogyne enterolobii TaxID=390850 RepID=A0A6V7VHU4_MELEN|nr:unnamed protein product [Meloidogyne enterolobii]